MLTLVGMLAVLGGPQVLDAGLVEEEELEELEEVMEELWRCRTCRYPSFSTFLFRVEFQWFLMELSVLRTKHRSCFRSCRVQLSVCLSAVTAARLTV